jgi:hypothetical protein
MPPAELSSIREGGPVVGIKILRSWLVALSVLAVTACSVPENSIEVKTARDAAAANTINGAAETPTFSVAEGAYGPAQT